MINGNFVDFLIYVHVRWFTQKDFIGFRNYSMDPDFSHCLEVFNKRKFKEVQECFLQIQEERKTKQNIMGNRNNIIN